MKQRKMRGELACYMYLQDGRTSQCTQLLALAKAASNSIVRPSNLRAMPLLFQGQNTFS
jgi:hypothetical protein